MACPGQGLATEYCATKGLAVAWTYVRSAGSMAPPPPPQAIVKPHKTNVTNKQSGCSGIDCFIFWLSPRIESLATQSCALEFRGRLSLICGESYVKKWKCKVMICMLADCFTDSLLRSKNSTSQNLGTIRRGGSDEGRKKPLPSRNCGSIPVPEAGPMCDKARFPWHRRCEIRRNVWLPHEVCC